MKWLRLNLEAAGFSRFTPMQVIVVGLALATLAASWVQLSFGVMGLSLFTFLAIPGIGLEALKIAAISRTDQLTKLWPEILDSMQSAASSGLGIVDSLDEIARTGPNRLRPVFSGLVQRMDAGLGIDNSLDWFKAELGISQADRLAELLRIVSKSGGIGYLEALRNQSKTSRSEIALWGELESKQGWVQGTAKLAIVAPWIIVATLSSRPENVAIYNTNQGLTILISGLLVSLVAYRVVALFGALTRPVRVFTK